MTGFYQGEPIDSTTLRGMGTDVLEASPGNVAAASFNPSENLGWWLMRQNPEGVVGPDGEYTPLPAEPTMPAEDANREFGIKGVLNFDAPVSRSTAQRLHETKQDQIARQDVIERRAPGVLTSLPVRLATGFAAGLLDPVNIAAGFIPVVGEARMGAMLAGAGGALGRTAVRTGVGAAQGAVGMAALEPLNYLRDTAEHNDWTMGEGLRNIAFGSVLGGGLHAIGGGLGELMRGAGRNPLSQRIEAAGPQARADMLRAGVAQMVDGRDVNVAPVLDMAETTSAYAERLATRNAGDATGTYAAFTPSGMRVNLRPEVVELDSLIASNLDSGAINPDYPAARQPRDRSTAGSLAQVQEISARLEPERLAGSPEAGTGAPIVGPDNVVDSGNGRLMALRRVYTDPRFADQAAAYRAFLTAQGHDVAGMRNPVLIGRRGELPPDQVAQLGKGANESAILRMTDAEQARADAERAGRAIDALRPGEIEGRQNSSFVSRFMAQLPVEERGGMMKSGSELSPTGARRIRAAVLAHAYGDAIGPTLERVLNDDTGHMRGLAGALVDVSGDWGRMRAAAARGEIPAGLDITAALGEAVQLIDRARAAGQPLAELLAQTDMLGGPSPAARALLQVFFRDADMRHPVGRERLAALLGTYAEKAIDVPAGPNLFGLPETTAPELLAAVAGDDARIARATAALRDAATAEPPEQAAASTLAVEAAQKAASAPAGEGAALTPAKAATPAPAEMAGAAAPVAPEPRLSPELRAAKDLADQMAASVQTELDAGRLTPADLAPLRAAEAGERLAQSNADAIEAAAACLITTGAA